MDRPVSRPPPWRQRRVLIAGGGGAGGLALLVAALLAVGGVSSVRVPAATVAIDDVQPGVFHDFVPLKGKAAPKEEIYLDVLDGGQVAEVLARSGDQVAAGQPLLRFRNTALELDVLDREGRLVESITQLQTYEKDLEQTRVANEKAAQEIAYNIVRLARADARREPLLARGFVPKEQTDQLKDELTYDQHLAPVQAESNRRQEALRQAQLPQIAVEMATLKESLAVTRSKLDSLVLKAPIAGKLTEDNLQVGQILKPGDRVGEVVPATGFKALADIDEYYLGRVAIGQGADVTIDGKSYPMLVTRVNPQVKDATFQVELAFRGQQPAGLLPGEALEGKLAVGGDRRALILPAGPWLERTGGDWVMVVAGDGGHAERRRIKLGARNAEQVEVLAGIRPGERVITSDYAAFEKVGRVDLSR
ncbi:MAG TPA: HlyD family efflux transporter periplasmic adaptor subunit [Caulobacteraceae bacterium]|nr:HlyD family efflux transporter periplasmic adaptor subunit [Caulobacteraceae bacterium]